MRRSYPFTSQHIKSIPAAYWDRTGQVVRNWKTDEELPDYEGLCLVYLDLRGPVVMRTFVQKGVRGWQERPRASLQTPSHCS